MEGENLEVIYENANGDGSLSGQIITNFVSNNVDMVCAIATLSPRAPTASRKEAISRLSTQLSQIRCWPSWPQRIRCQ